MQKILSPYCKTPGCKRLREARSNGTRAAHCNSHTHKQRNHYGLAVKKQGRPFELFGSTRADKDGYITIYFCGKEVRVHRLVDIITNGPLPAGYDVHHKDEVKTHNHWTNLQRMTKAHHTALHKGNLCSSYQRH